VEAINGVVTAQGGLAEDIQGLNDKIAELQNSPGTFSTADQATPTPSRPPARP